MSFLNDTDAAAERANVTKALHTAAKTNATLAELAAMLGQVKGVRTATQGIPDYLRHIDAAYDHLRRAVADVSRHAFV